MLSISAKVCDTEAIVIKCKFALNPLVSECVLDQEDFICIKNIKCTGSVNFGEFKICVIEAWIKALLYCIYLYTVYCVVNVY